MKQVIPVLLGVLFLAMCAGTSADRMVTGLNDFTSFYVGAKLAGTPGLYNIAANASEIRAIHGTYMQHTTFVRPPFYAALLKPLAAFPYRPAWWTFALLSVLTTVWFAARFGGGSAELAVLTAWNLPVVLTVMNGQDSLLLMAVVAAGVLMLRRGRDFVAGALMAVCAIKPHLFVFVAVLVVLKSRWRIAAGMCTAGAGLAVLGTMVNGVDCWREWIYLLHNRWIDPPAELTPNLHGLVTVMGGGPGLEWAMIAGSAMLFLVAARRFEDFEALFAVALICGLLTSFHSAPTDDVFLLLAFALLMKRGKPVRILLAISLCPVPYLLLLTCSSLAMALPVLLVGVMAAVAFEGCHIVSAAQRMPMSRWAVFGRAQSGSETRTSRALL